MSSSTPSALAKKHKVSVSVVNHLVEVMQHSCGSMAQFNHPELGGYGQWMRGGMTMVGDMFNNALKAKVDALCSDVSDYVAAHPRAEPKAEAEARTSGGQWWPNHLGKPASVGGQNEFAYAYFPKKNRLAVRQGRKVHVFDSTGHSITGFSQQQSNDIQGFHFSSQKGMHRASSLPKA